MMNTSFKADFNTDKMTEDDRKRFVSAFKAATGNYKHNIGEKSVSMEADFGCMGCGIVKHSELMIKRLVKEYPKLQAEIRGQYMPAFDNLMLGYDDFGGFFTVKCDNGITETEDTPIV